VESFSISPICARRERDKFHRVSVARKKEEKNSQLPPSRTHVVGKRRRLLPSSGERRRSFYLLEPGGTSRSSKRRERRSLWDKVLSSGKRIRWRTLLHSPKVLGAKLGKERRPCFLQTVREKERVIPQSTLSSRCKRVSFLLPVHWPERVPMERIVHPPIFLEKRGGGGIGPLFR